MSFRIAPVRRYPKPRYPGTAVRRRAEPISIGRIVGAVAAAGIGADACTMGSVGVLDPGPFHSEHYLLEAEARAIIREVVEAETGTPVSPCERPVLAGRLLEDQWLEHPGAAGGGSIRANVDLLAPEMILEPSGSCPGGRRPLIGIEYEGAGEPDLHGFVAGERTSLAALREAGELAVLLIPETVCLVTESHTGEVISDRRAEAEEEVRTVVREFVRDLRNDGFL